MTKPVDPAATRQYIHGVKRELDRLVDALEDAERRATHWERNFRAMDTAHDQAIARWDAAERVIELGIAWARAEEAYEAVDDSDHDQLVETSVDAATKLYNLRAALVEYQSRQPSSDPA